jgi:hypothetical protein
MNRKVPGMRTAIAYWLIPTEPACGFFGKVIADLAWKYDGPVFEPHLTVYVGSDQAEVAEEIFSRGAIDCEPIQLKAIDVSYSDEFTKTLFVRFMSNAKLEQLSQIIRQASEAPRDYQFEPHLSLLYKKIPMLARRELTSSIKLPFSMVIFDSIKAVRCACRRVIALMLKHGVFLRPSRLSSRTISLSRTFVDGKIVLASRKNQRARRVRCPDLGLTYRVMEGQAANIKIFGDHDEATVKQIERCVAEDGARGVLCADGHKGYAQPIGGVVAYKNKISLSGVGFDIACGNLAILTDAKREQVAPKIEKIMDAVVRDISFGIGRKSKTRVEHELFDDPAWELQPMRGLKPMAAEQLGTVGGGNHYVDLFADEQERIWVGVHFGSRGLGHKTATYFLKKA